MRPFLLWALLVGTAQAQDYPGKPVRMVVGFPPGGGTDMVRADTARYAQIVKDIGLKID